MSIMSKGKLGAGLVPVVYANFYAALLAYSGVTAVESSAQSMYKD